MKYDFLIVGAGFYGCVCANQLSAKGYRVKLIDKRNHIGGNCFTELKDNIVIHKYGAHIFHTYNKEIWDFVNRFSKFNSYKHRVIAHIAKGEFVIPRPLSCILSHEEIIELFFKPYSIKQWGRKWEDLPHFVKCRVPQKRQNESEQYFMDTYQGIPIGGYTGIFEQMIDDERVDFETNIDYCKDKNNLSNIAKYIIFTGKIDEFFDYCYGELEYRSLIFENSFIKNATYQDAAVVNYPDIQDSWIRIVEHKLFDYNGQRDTWITKEFPICHNKEINEPFYSFGDNKNIVLYKKYHLLRPSNVFFGGRLGGYQYYDMDKVILSALNFCEEF